MALLVDTPRWPAHGTRYGHLVSDSSLWELHAFARRIGLDARGFDHDHYDLAERHLPAALAAGAELVDERVLVTRLRARGLRILPAEHAPRRGRARARMRELFTPVLGATVVDELLAEWTAPGRWYHDVRHLDEMVRALQLLGAGPLDDSAPLAGAELLAALFHDVVYDGVAGQDEQRSAETARRVLTAAGRTEALVAEVERLVLLTIGHVAEPGDETGARVCDADLAILGSAPGRYHVSVRDIRLEYARFDDAEWRAGRRVVLQGFLGTAHLFATDEGRRRWEQAARRNTADELAHLDDPV